MPWSRDCCINAVLIYGKVVSFHHACSVQLQQLWKDIIMSKIDLGDCTRIWQNCHYVITEGTRRRLARKSFKGNLPNEIICLLFLKNLKPVWVLVVR